MTLKIHAYKLFIVKTRWLTEIFNISLKKCKNLRKYMFHGKLKSGIHINNNLINYGQEDQHWIWKCHDFMIRMKSVFKHFLLLPSIGLAGHLSQMQEKMCVLNLNCHRYRQIKVAMAI